MLITIFLNMCGNIRLDEDVCFKTAVPKALHGLNSDNDLSKTLCALVSKLWPRPGVQLCVPGDADGVGNLDHSRL